MFATENYPAFSILQSVPTVSIILPVYNTSKYLRECIDSILSQTFTDFELIIINDGSIDDSESVIKSYTDARIRFFNNESNKGLIYTLNRGIIEAKGEYITRMDGDDICDLDRLRTQIDFLNRNPNVSITASCVELIDADGKPIGNWEDDVQAISYAQIKKHLIKTNCIAHPAVTGKAEVFKKFKYDETQHRSEDYDLWLRIIHAGLIIEKTKEPLLKHRIISSSFTRQRQKNVFFKMAKVKTRFVLNRIKEKKFNSFVFAIACSALADHLKGLIKTIKRLFVK